MNRTPFFSMIAVVAFSGAAFAGAPATHSAWATGKIARVDDAAHAVVVTQGHKQITFTLASGAKVTQAGKTLTTSDLGADVGQPVKVRYSMLSGSRMADLVQVGTTPAAHAVTHKAKKSVTPKAKT